MNNPLDITHDAAKELIWCVMLRLYRTYLIHEENCRKYHEWEEQWSSGDESDEPEREPTYYEWFDVFPGREDVTLQVINGNLVLRIEFTDCTIKWYVDLDTSEDFLELGADFNETPDDYIDNLDEWATILTNLNDAKYEDWQVIRRTDQKSGK